MEEKYILSLDIGTSTIRSFIYNSRAELVSKAITEASKNNKKMFLFVGFLFKLGVLSVNFLCIFKFFLKCYIVLLVF